MGEADPGIPTWAMRSIFLTALALLLAALLLWLMPAGLVASRAGAGLLAVHYLLNGLVFYAVWLTHQPQADDSTLMAVASRLGGFGFGMMDLVLAGHALFDFQPHNAVLLPLVVPGALGFVIVSLGDYRKQSEEENTAIDEAVLAGTDDKPAAPITEVATVGGISAVLQGLYWLAVLVSVALGAAWYMIVWLAIDGGRAFQAPMIFDILQNAVLSQGRYILVVVSGIAVMVLAFAVGGHIVGRIGAKIKAVRRARRPLTPAQAEDAETCLKAVWEYANRDRPSRVWVVVVLPLVLFGAALAAVFIYANYDAALAFRLAAASRAFPAGWYVFNPSSAGGLFVMVGGTLIAWSVWHAVVDRVPGAAEVLMSLSYRRNSDAAAMTVSFLRAQLRRMARKGKLTGFEPRQFLYRSRRCYRRWLYAVTLVVGVGSAIGVWGCLNSYTLLTPAGIETHSAFAPAAFRPWTDVRWMNLGCTLDDERRPSFTWEAGFADGSEAYLAHQAMLADNLAALVEVDAILRGQGTEFRLRDSAGRSTVSKACLDDVGARLPDRTAFMRLMHQD